MVLPLSIDGGGTATTGAVEPVAFVLVNAANYLVLLKKHDLMERTYIAPLQVLNLLPDLNQTVMELQKYLSCRRFLCYH